MHRRLALVLGLALLLGAVAFTLAPSSTSNANCGSWFNPEWEKGHSKALAAKALEQTNGTFPEIDARARALASDIAENYRMCTDELTRRRNLSIGLFAGAVVVPVAILFIVGREDKTTIAA